MNKLIKSFLLALSISMPIVHGRPNSARSNHAKVARKNTNNVKAARKNTNHPQQVIFEHCKDEKMYKKLLENEKLIKSVLSKFPELGTINVGVNDSYGCAYVSSDGIYLDSSWFTEDDTVKEFIIAHEAAHEVCNHWISPTLKRALERSIDKNEKKLSKNKKIDADDGLRNRFNKKIEDYIDKTDEYIRRNKGILTFLSYGLIGFGEILSILKLEGLVSYKKDWILPISSLTAGITGLAIIHYRLKPSRQNEREADLMAVERLGTAEGGIKYFEKENDMLKKLIRKLVPSTHPSESERIAYLKEWQSKHQ